MPAEAARLLITFIRIVSFCLTLKEYIKRLDCGVNSESDLVEYIFWTYLFSRGKQIII